MGNSFLNNHLECITIKDQLPSKKRETPRSMLSLHSSLDQLELLPTSPPNLPLLLPICKKIWRNTTRKWKTWLKTNTFTNKVLVLLVPILFMRLLMDIDKKLISMDNQLPTHGVIQFTLRLTIMINMNGTHGPINTPMSNFITMLMLINHHRHILQVTTVTTHTLPMILTNHTPMLISTIKIKELLVPMLVTNLTPT